MFIGGTDRSIAALVASLAIASALVAALEAPASIWRSAGPSRPRPSSP